MTEEVFRSPRPAVAALTSEWELWYGTLVGHTRVTFGMIPPADQAPVPLIVRLGNEGSFYELWFDRGENRFLVPHSPVSAALGETLKVKAQQPEFPGQEPVTPAVVLTDRAKYLITLATRIRTKPLPIEVHPTPYVPELADVITNEEGFTFLVVSRYPSMLLNDRPRVFRGRDRFRLAELTGTELEHALGEFAERAQTGRAARPDGNLIVAVTGSTAAVVPGAGSQQILDL